jgi:hypothetical protein
VTGPFFCPLQKPHQNRHQTLKNSDILGRALAAKPSELLILWWAQQESNLDFHRVNETYILRRIRRGIRFQGHLRRTGRARHVGAFYVRANSLSSSRFQKDRMSSEARYRMVKFSYKQFVTIRLLLLHASTNLAMRTNELERRNAGSLLMPKRGDFFKSLEFPAIAGDSPIAKFTIHSVPVSTNYATAAWSNQQSSSHQVASSMSILDHRHWL